MFELVPTNNTVTQVSEILSKLFESKIPENCASTINQLISKMLIHHSNNPRLVDLLGSLAVRSNVNIDSVKIWIEKLPEILSTKNGTAKHRQVVQFLLKQRNGTLLKVLPQNFNYFELMKQCWNYFLNKNLFENWSFLWIQLKRASQNFTPNFDCGTKGLVPTPHPPINLFGAIWDKSRDEY